VDTLVASGIHFHQPVMVESPTNLNATYNNGTAGVGATLTNAGTQVELIIDGIFTSPGDRVLVYSQTNPIENGIYVVTVVGTVSTNWVLTRASDANTYVINSANGLSEGSTVFVQLGATGAGETYTCNTSGVITFGTTNITFAQISSAQIYSAGTGLTLSGTQFSITNTGTAGTYGSASSVPVITTNAQGQVTGVTPTAIAISGAAVSGNISGQAGSVANALTAGSFLTSGGTFDGSAARTFAVDATSANTASKVVARDASGNFSAGTITATLSGAATSATTATNLAGGAANRIAYQTSAGITDFITAPTASNQVLNWNGSAFTWSAGTISGVALGSNLNALTFGTYLTGTSYNGSSAVTIATNATNANTASTIVARDASGNFSAGTITATLNGNASTATTASNVNNGTLTMNVSGTGLSGSQTFTANQAGNATFTVTSNATAANTGSTIVARDAGGSFSAGTITATLSGNASTATSATSATFLNSSNYINRTVSSGNLNTDFQNTPAGSTRIQGDDAGGTNGAGGTWWFYQNMRHSNASNLWGTQVAWGWEDNANRLRTRNITGGTFGSWIEYYNTTSTVALANGGTGGTTAATGLRNQYINSWNRETNNGTMVPGNTYSIWTGGGAITMYLPTIGNCQNGDKIYIQNLHLTWATNNFTIARSDGATRIMMLSENLVCNVNVGSIVLTLVWDDGGTADWNVAPGG